MIRSKETMQIQVGAFAAVGLILLMVVIFMLGSEKKFFESQYDLIVRFDDISGLRLGAPVQLAGINVGTVSQILFDEKIDKKKVKLVLRLSESYQDRIREDSMATIVTQGLLGDKMIFVTVGSPDKKILKNGSTLPTSPTSGFYQVLENSDRLIRRVDEIAKTMNDLTKEIKQGKGVLHALIYDPQGEQIVKNLSEASAHLAEVSDKINQGEGTLGALINDPSLFNDMQTLLGKANRNKLVRAVIRHTLKTKDEAALQK